MDGIFRDGCAWQRGHRARWFDAEISHPARSTGSAWPVVCFAFCESMGVRSGFCETIERAKMAASTVHPHMLRNLGGHAVAVAGQRTRWSTEAILTSRLEITMPTPSQEWMKRWMEQQSGQPVSEERARAALENLVGFFEVLIRWDREDREAAAKKAEESPTQAKAPVGQPTINLRTKRKKRKKDPLSASSASSSMQLSSRPGPQAHPTCPAVGRSSGSPAATSAQRPRR